jgi:hypothetical protein
LNKKLGLCLKPNPYLALVIKRSVETTVVQINSHLGIIIHE